MIIKLIVEDGEALPDDRKVELLQRIRRPLWSDAWEVTVESDGKIVVEVRP